MRLKTIEIRDYKCFEKYKVDFAPSVTVIIGRNGSGKTALISAINKVLSFIFSSDKSLGDDFLSAGNPSLKVSTFDMSDYRRDDEKGTTTNDLSIRAEAIYADQPLSWELYKRATGGAKLYASKYKEAFSQFMSAYKGGADLPLLAYYSDSFPHRNTKETKFALDTIKLDRTPRNFGYYQWDMESDCISIWEKRLTYKLNQKNRLDGLKEEVDEREQQRLLENILPLYKETHFVESRLKTFVSQLPALKRDGYDIDYLIRSMEGDGMDIGFKNGKSILLQDLPAGYRRLYSIVFDMAYRAYILNGVEEPTGIVVIDEIDLHLHPSLEQEVVAALHATFPEVQFIISTHSAAVISNLNTAKQGNEELENCVLFMQEGQEQADPLPNIYGLDYNAALRDFMDTPASSGEIRRLRNEYLTFCSLGLDKEAESTMIEIKKLLGREDHPILEQIRKDAEAYEVR